MMLQITTKNLDLKEKEFSMIISIFILKLPISILFSPDRQFNILTIDVLISPECK